MHSSLRSGVNGKSGPISTPKEMRAVSAPLVRVPTYERARPLSRARHQPSQAVHALQRHAGGGAHRMWHEEQRALDYERLPPRAPSTQPSHSTTVGPARQTVLTRFNLRNLTIDLGGPGISAEARRACEHHRACDGGRREAGT
jgi:hypothetical protein